MTDRAAKPRQRKRRERAPRRAPIVVAEDDPQPTPAKRLSTLTPIPEKPGMQLPEAPSSVLQVVQSPNQKPPMHHWTEWEADEALVTIRNQYKLPTLHQPSKIVPYALDMAFISHFVQLNMGVRSYSQEIPWITHIPTLHTKATKPALRLAIRSASMACYATVHKDPTVLVDSYRWYTMSLNSQRQSLTRLNGNSIPTEEEILVPIILGLYEVYAGTTTTSVFQHLAAATKIIEMRGPANCTRVAFPLFKAMRVSDAHKSMVFNQPSPFSAPEWMTIPFKGQSRNAHQYLADILLVIPECIGKCNMGGSMRSFFERTIPPNVDLKPVREHTLQLLQELDDWAARCPHLTKMSFGPQVVGQDMENLAASGSVPASLDNSTLILPDSFVALTAATYEAIRLILSLLLDKVTYQPSRSSSVSGEPSTPIEIPIPTLLDTANMCSKAILDIVSYLEATHPVGFDFMRSVFPLVVVAILGPRAEEIKVAKQMLDRWGKKRGMAGLCAAWLHI